MRNLMKSGKATISIVLVILMAFLLPVQVFAETFPEREDTGIVTFDSLNEANDSANIVTELVDLRDEYTKQFRMDDGTIMAVTYNCPVHYKNSKGKWLEYDNTLVAENEATTDEAVPKSYINKKSDTNIELSANTDTDDLVNINSPKGNISWKYESVNKSDAKIKNSKGKHKGNEKFTSIDKLSAQANYNNIYDNIDINCIVSTTGVKENIILKNPDAQNEFVIDYNIKGLKAKQTGEKYIKLYKGKKLVYTITAPYMYDSEGNESTELSFDILSNKGNHLRVKLIADKDFLNSFGRVYPVTIDPEVSISGSTNTETAQIRDNQPDIVQNQSTHFMVGKSSLGTYSGLVKLKNVQENYSGKNIVSAKLNLFPMNLSSEMEIEAYPITSSWSNNTATHNNIAYDTEVIDYVNTKGSSSDKVTLDLTKYVKKWANGTATNNGIYLKSDDSFTDFGGYECYFSDKKPTFVVRYREYTGSESNLTSHTVACGQNAQASVCDYTGSLTVRQNIYEEKGARFPLSIYATNHSVNSSVDEKGGCGWHFSFNQTLSLRDGYYVYTDADGVEHYFRDYTENELYDEDDLFYTLTKKENIIEVNNGSAIQSYDVPEINGTTNIKSELDVNNSKNKLLYNYDSNGLVTSIESTYAKYVINRTSSSVINSITKIEKYTNYSENLVYLTYYGGTNKLSRFRFPSGKSSCFYYTSYDDVAPIRGVIQKGESDGMKLLCTYNSDNKVNNISEYGTNGTVGKSLSISYGDNTTVFEDVNEYNKQRKTTYTFDNYGNTVSVLNANGYMVSGEDIAELSCSGHSDSYTKNYIEESSDFDSIGTTNYFKYTNGTIGTETSSGGVATVATDDYYLGGKSIKITHSNTNQFYTAAYHDFTLNSSSFSVGDTVTLSAYVKMSSNITKGDKSGAYGAIVKMKCLNSSNKAVLDKNSPSIFRTFEGSYWQRISLTITIPAETIKLRVYCALRNAQGSAWFDCLQLEKSETMNDYNVLANSDFTTQNKWQCSNNASISTLNKNATIIGNGGGMPYTESSSDDNTEFDDISNSENEETATESNSELQTYTVKTTEVEDYGSVQREDEYGNIVEKQQGVLVREITKTYLMDDNTNDPQEDVLDDFSILDEEYQDDEESENSTDEEPDSYVYQNIPINKVGVSFNISGTALANSVPLTTSDRTFGIMLIINYAEGDSEYQYKSFNSFYTGEQNICTSITPDLTDKLINSVDFYFVYGHNKNTMIIKNAMLNIAHTEYTLNADNMTDDESENGSDDDSNTQEDITSTTETTDNYIDYQETERIDTSSPYMQTNVEYDSTGNFVTSEINDAGKTTEYEYDNNGNVTKIIEPNSNATSYGYDSDDNLISVENGSSTVSYTYNNSGNLSAINHNNFAYQYNYDIYNNLIATKVGNKTLVSNTYNTGNGNLISTRYGNGYELLYSYDDYDNVTEIKEKDNNTTNVIVTYAYNKKGLVSKCVDTKSGDTTIYEYDCRGDLVNYIVDNTSEGTKSAYCCYYNEKGEFVEINSLYGYERKVISGTDESGNSYLVNDDLKLTTEKDKFDRVTSYSQKLNGYNNYNFSTNLTYATSGIGKATNNLVSEYVQSFNENPYTTYKYLYDDNGNITEVKEKASDSDTYKTKLYFRYNDSNQIISVNDYYVYTYATYTYDNYGNITQKGICSLSPIGGYPISATTYTDYTYDADWKDKLSTYNGEALTYDEIGNPLSYRDSMTMTWKGRELSTFTCGNTTATFQYNKDGLRTVKDVNGVKVYYFYNLDKKLIGLKNGAFTVAYYYDSDDSVSSMSFNGSFYYFLKNNQGDIVGIASENGRVRVKYTYDAWGNITSVKNANGQEITDTWGNIAPFRYRGYVYDTDTGLYYLQSRYYDPKTGRFINADAYTDTKSGTPLSANMFAYCENNPVMGYDPEGYWDYSKHIVLCKIAGFGTTVRTWVEYADTKFASDNEYSAPFHSRNSKPNARYIAMYLYNKAIRLIREYSNGYKNKVQFKYHRGRSSNCDNKTTYYLDDYYLGYISKTGINKGKKITTNNKAQNLLTELNKLGNRKMQSDALLGLALHVVQDYFAHLTKINVYSNRVLVFSGITTSFSNDILKNPGKLEDNTKEISWRYTNAQRITYVINDMYQKKRYMNGIKVVYVNNRFIPHQLDAGNGTLYTIKTREYYLKIT